MTAGNHPTPPLVCGDNCEGQFCFLPRTSWDTAVLMEKPEPNRTGLEHGLQNQSPCFRTWSPLMAS